MEAGNQFHFNQNLVSGGYQLQKFQSSEKENLQIEEGGKIGFGELKDHVVTEKKQNPLARLVSRAFPSLGRVFENYNRIVLSKGSEGIEFTDGKAIRDQIKGHTTHLKEVNHQIKDAKKEIKELDQAIRKAVTFDTAFDKEQVSKMVEKRNDLIGQLVGFRQDWVSVKNQLREIRKGAEGTFLQGTSVMVQLGRTEKKLDQTFQYFSAGLLRSEHSYRFQSLKDNINGHVAAMMTSNTLQDMGLVTNMSQHHMQPIREEVNKMIGLRNQAIESGDTAALEQIDSYLAGLPPECTRHIRETGNALPSRMLDFDKPGTEMTDETRQAIGSQGLTTNYDGTVVVSHESYGTQKDKEDKAGKNCDRAFGEKTTQGNFRFGVFDGSGAKAHALKTASACMSYAQDAMSRNAFSGAQSAEDCKARGSKIFEESVKPESNPAIAKAMGYPKEGEELDDAYTRTDGQTTALILETERTDSGKVRVMGAAAGDCCAFVISGGRCSSLYMDPAIQGGERNSRMTGGSLNSPGLKKNGETQNGRVAGAVEGVYAEVDSGSIIIAASDALTDNLHEVDIEQIVQFIVHNSAFDSVPGEMPPNLYRPPENTAADLRKPTLEDLGQLFPDPQNRQEATDNTTAATRLQNYVAWISTAQIANMQTMKNTKVMNGLESKERSKFMNRLGDTGKLDDAAIMAIQV